MPYLGQGELDVNSLRKSIVCAFHYKLVSLTDIVYRNDLQIDSFTEEVMCLKPLFNKGHAFGWYTAECYIYMNNKKGILKENERKIEVISYDLSWVNMFSKRP